MGILVRDMNINADSSSGLMAGCQIVVGGDLAVHGMKVVQHPDGSGRLLVCFPQKPLLTPCLSCKRKCDVIDSFCRWCGGRMPPQTTFGKARHTDIVHPISDYFRNSVNDSVLAEYYQLLSTLRR